VVEIIVVTQPSAEGSVVLGEFMEQLMECRFTEISLTDKIVPHLLLPAPLMKEEGANLKRVE
jgi:hypothetical protein